MATPTAIAAYLVLFLAVGVIFLFANLLIGRLVRPKDPDAEKLDVYECGEPAIGSSFVQFDLRFYVVALVFIVFDAEVAFLFPVTTVFGKQTQLADVRLELVEHSSSGTVDSATPALQPGVQIAPAAAGQTVALTPSAKGLFGELGMVPPSISPDPLKAKAQEEQIRNTINQFTFYVYGAILFFFLVLFVGFAYEWKTGAFDWVRAVSRPPNPSLADLGASSLGPPSLGPPSLGPPSLGPPSGGDTLR